MPRYFYYAVNYFVYELAFIREGLGHQEKKKHDLDELDVTD